MENLNLISIQNELREQNQIAQKAQDSKIQQQEEELDNQQVELISLREQCESTSKLNNMLSKSGKTPTIYFNNITL